MQNSYHQSWIAAADITMVNGYYVECAQLNQNFVEAMMDGLIDFSMLREAAKLLVVCLQEQWTVSTDILGRLLHACIGSLDSTAAKVIIQGLLDNINQTTSMIIGPKTISHSAVRQLRHLLNICQAASLPEDNNLALGASTNPPSKTNLDRLATAIWIRETGNNSSIMISRLRRVKQALSEEKSLSARLDLAISVLDAEAERPVRKLEKTERVRRTAHIDWLETQHVASAKKIREAEHVICNALAKQTPRAMKAWWQFSPDVPIDQRVELAMAFGTPGTMQHQIAMCYAKSRDMDTQLKTALLKALPRDLAKPLVATRNDTGDVSLEKTVVHFERYMTALRKQRAEKAEKAEAAEAAARVDPFSRLMERLPKPSISFWQRAPPSAAAASSGQGW